MVIDAIQWKSVPNLRNFLCLSPFGIKSVNQLLGVSCKSNDYFVVSSRFAQKEHRRSQSLMWMELGNVKYEFSTKPKSLCGVPLTISRSHMCDFQGSPINGYPHHVFMVTMMAKKWMDLRHLQLCKIPSDPIDPLAVKMRKLILCTSWCVNPSICGQLIITRPSPPSSLAHAFPRIFADYLPAIIGMQFFFSFT